LSVYRRYDEQFRWRRHRSLGRAERVLLLRLTSARRAASASACALDGRTDPPIRRRCARRLRLQPIARIHAPATLVPRIPARSGAARFALERTELRGTAPAVLITRPPDEAVIGPHARRDLISVGLRYPCGLEIP